MKRDPLEAVNEAALAVASARRQLHGDIRKAAKHRSLRDVAAAAGMSHEQVRKIARGEVT